MAIGQFAVFVAVACFFKEGAGFEQVGAYACFRVCLRRLGDGLVQDGGVEGVAEGLEQFQLFALRLACRRHFAVGEEAVAAAVCAVENACVDAFKVETLNHRLPHEDVVERDAAHIHNKALHAGIALLHPFVLAQAAFGEHFARISPRPVSGDVFINEVVLSGFEAFETDAVVFEIFEADGVEVISENDCPVVGRFDFGNIAPVDAVGGIGGFVLGKQAEGGGDVFGKHGIAVVEFSLRVEPECCRQSVFGKPEVFRQQAVHGERFVPTVVREIVHGQHEDADFFVAFEGERVERVKAALHR